VQKVTGWSVTESNAARVRGSFECETHTTFRHVSNSSIVSSVGRHIHLSYFPIFWGETKMETASIGGAYISYVDSYLIPH
jgi:hypothetical protein